MSEQIEDRCELCNVKYLSEQNRTAHLSGSKHRKTVEKVITEDRERLDASKSAVETMERRLSNATEAVEDSDNTLNAQREEIETNADTLKEQSEQIAKISTDIVTLKPEYDCLTQKVAALRSERDALTRDVEALTAEKSKTEKTISELVEQIKKTVELRPELERAAREEIIEQLVREESSRLSREKGERLEIQRLYQTGEISLTNYIRRTRALKE